MAKEIGSKASSLMERLLKNSTMKTYDVYFDDDTNSNNKVFAETLDYCVDYIKRWNGTTESYFADYKG